MAFQKFLIVRLMNLVVCFALVVAVLALSVSTRATLFDSYSLEFGAGAGAATTATLGLMIPLQFVKRDMFVSKVIVEWLVFSTFWAVWLVCAVFFGLDNAQWGDAEGSLSCGYSDASRYGLYDPAYVSDLREKCQRLSTLTILSVFALLCFTGYGVSLLVATIRMSKRIGSKGTWFASVRELGDDTIRRTENLNQTKQSEPSSGV